jgi:hypothetical protein
MMLGWAVMVISRRCCHLARDASAPMSQRFRRLAGVRNKIIGIESGTLAAVHQVYFFRLAIIGSDELRPGGHERFVLTCGDLLI